METRGSEPIIFGEFGNIVNEEEGNKLSDDEINELVKTLEESISDDVKNLRDINNNTYPINAINKPELMEGEVLMEIDAKTGENKILGPASEIVSDNGVTVDNIIDGTDKELLDSVTIKEETYGKLNELGISEEDAIVLTKLITRRLNNEKFSIYKELPNSIKNMVRAMCGSNNINQLQACSEIVLDQFISELKIEQEFIDFQETLKKEMDIPNLVDMYGEYLKESMEIKLIEKANQIQETDPEKAKVLLEISAAYTDSYTFRRQLEAFANNVKECRRLDKELKKYDRYCTEFNYKYKDTKFKINDVKLLEPTLQRVFKESEYDTFVMRRFVILFCRLTRNLDANNVVEHSFMYYTIKNILSLDYLDIHSEMYSTIKNNIETVFKAIDKKRSEELKGETITVLV